MLQAVRHLALIALLLRAMLPAGWMPDAQAGLTICSATLGPIHHDGAPAKEHQAKEQCPFAAAPQLASVPDVPRFGLPAVHAFAAVRDRAFARVISRHFTPQSPRAPPQVA